MTSRRAAYVLAIFMLSVLLAGHLGPLSSRAANSDPRERPPFNVTPTATANQLAGDGTGMVDEVTPETVVVDAGVPLILPVATNESVLEVSNETAIRQRPEPRTFVNPASQAD